MNRSARLLALLATAAAWPVPAASATDYCVAPNTSCGGTNVPTFEAALALADDANDSDGIFLGARTYLAPVASGFSYNRPGGPVEIAGAGAGKTILTGPLGGSRVLFVNPGPGTSVHDLTVRLPEFAAGGLEATGVAVRRIEVVEAASQANVRTGVALFGGSLDDSTVTLGHAQNTFGVSLAVEGGAIRDSTVQARTAVGAARGGSVEHSVLRGDVSGIQTGTLTTTITDSLISVTDPTGTAIAAATQAGADTTINASGVTLVGPGTADSIGVLASNSLVNAQKVAVNLADTVLRGFDHALMTIGVAPGQADIHTSYSDYDPSGNSETGPGGITPSNVTNLGDARFVDAAGGDYRLRFDSPLIDMGEPGAPATLTDLAGGARLIDGDAVAGARRDIGAFEYQAHAPVASISGPAAARTGERVTFSGAGSSDADPGDTIAAYAWTIDGSPAGSGPTLGATFQTAGVHSVALTVTDPAGRKGSATRKVTVTQTVGPPPPRGDTTAPTLSDLRARPARVRRGRRIAFRFQLSEAAAVRLEIQRARPGRREGRACRKPRPRNRTGRRCTRHVRVIVLKAAAPAGANRVRFSGRVRGAALAPGRYRARISATDAAGNRSLTQKVSFKVVTA